MKIVFSSQASEDNLFKTPQRVKNLIRAIVRDPFQGVGKPEPLRHDLAGCWSRRIDEEHRLIYRIDGDAAMIVQARYH